MGFKVDSELLTTPEVDPVWIFASQRLRSKSDISGSLEQKPPQRFQKTIELNLLASKKGRAWKVPPKLNAIQVLPDHILLFISTMFRDYFLYEIGPHLPIDRQVLVLPSWFHSTNTKAF